MCCGQLPFVGESMAQLMYKIANEPAPEAASVNGAISPELNAVIARSMAKDPDERYQRGNDLAADLRACLAGSGRASPDQTGNAGDVDITL